jgi:hypothetical protein
MRENRTSGTVQGAPGNRRSYCETATVVSQCGVVLTMDRMLLRTSVLSRLRRSRLA